MKNFIKTTITEYLNEKSFDNIDINKYLEIYTNYYGYSDGFSSVWNHLLKNDFNNGGLLNIPNYIFLSRLINIKNNFEKENNVHWIRTSDEHIFYDKDWLFLTNILINENTKIIRMKTKKSNIDLEKTIIQNIKFPYEKEVSLKKINITKYDILNYRKKQK